MENLVIHTKNLGKSYGRFKALQDVNLAIPQGRIVGLIGANGSGKTTMLNSILGLATFDGELKVLGLDPVRQRHRLMKDICFIADVATLPKWMKVCQVLDFVQNIHPRFNRKKALDFLSRTQVPLKRKIKKLSKGMTVQVHLALVMSIESKLLVLDEPTLGLDIVFRKEFYRSLLEEYFDENKTILITTHQVEEVEHILSDVIFLKEGRIVLSSDMETLLDRFHEVTIDKGREEEAEKLSPIMKSRTFGKTTYVFRDGDKARLKQLGEVKHLDLSDIFVATVKGEA